MTKTIKIIGLTGSLREKSYNMAALRASAELLPEWVTLEILDLSSIPFFNEDIESEGVPQVVADFKRRLAEADAILISTPEYNYSIPPVLKNALDWASRGTELPLSGKPLAIMSASPDMLGGARVQYHLRQVCLRLRSQTLKSPKVLITNAKNKFDQDGKLIDNLARKSISKLLQALLDKTKTNPQLDQPASVVK
ncbi:putative flavoprotein [Desulfosporosinus acidiphilus SJ4]|uniref:Putative flavoprotein n=1 Tax=Desulfosporosinus acidiphilus (strain DSM 22704 / JCM 16185 / SJ4) TaxID=646529 RepID=I4D7S5_DESAJ|nr:NAD(P)H-dependent oxidoreductase [Desulfosporosinus acidiphilus]AFM41849.1 putative flavoprotein [Desulfosporosinus acidiphilus SJ4]